MLCKCSCYKMSVLVLVLFMFFEHWELHSRALRYLSVLNSKSRGRIITSCGLWSVLEHHGQRLGAHDGGKTLENMFRRKRLIHSL